MVLKPEALRARILKLEEVVAGLVELADTTPGAGVRDAWAVERGLQLAAEIAFDTGNHILSAHFGVSATDYEDILEQLARRTVISAELRERLRGLGGFRNLLVHHYLRLDPGRVRDRLRAAPDDFTDFAREIARWLDSLA